MLNKNLAQDYMKRAETDFSRELEQKTCLSFNVCYFRRKPALGQKYWTLGLYWVEFAIIKLFDFDHIKTDFALKLRIF